MAAAKDSARAFTDKEIFRLNKLAEKRYAKASEDIEEPIREYLKKHEKKRQKWLKEFEDGEITKAELRKRRVNDFLDDAEFLLLLDECAEREKRATRRFWLDIMESIPKIYAESYNWGLYRSENVLGRVLPLGILTGSIVEQLLGIDPSLIILPGQAAKLNQGGKAGRKARDKEKEWQKALLRTAFLITADLSVPLTELIRQILEWVERRNVSAGKEYGGTASNTAENKGRNDAFRDAGKEAGETDDPLMRVWVAIMDERTRVAHRILDGTWVGMEEPWTIDGFQLMFPGDPSAPAYLIRNCRCSVDIGRKSEAHGSVHQNERFNGQSYEEWKKAKPFRTVNPGGAAGSQTA